MNDTDNDSDDVDHDVQSAKGTSADYAAAIPLGAISINDWILVKFTDDKEFEGIVDNIFANFTFTINFARCRKKASLEFVWANVQDICDVEHPKIVSILQSQQLGIAAL